MKVYGLRWADTDNICEAFYSLDKAIKYLNDLGYYASGMEKESLDDIYVPNWDSICRYCCINEIEIID